MVTVLALAAKPSSTWRGSHGLRASFSAKQKEYRPGVASVAWNEPRHVPNHQPQGPSNGRIGPVAGSEAARVAVDVHLPGDRTVDDDHGGGAAGGGLAACDIKLRLQYRSDGSDHHRKVLRAAAGHHRIHGDFFQRHRGVARLDDP
jgi:hypothetical protein